MQPRTPAPLAFSLESALSEIDTLKTPEGADEAVFTQLKLALREALIARGQKKIISAPPSGDANAVNDLTAVDNGDLSFQLTWSYRNLGDYDQNGTTGVSDITPIAMHFREALGSNNDWIDGSGNGEIDVSDITQIAMFYGVTCEGYQVQLGDSPESELYEVYPVYLPDPSSGSRTVVSSRITTVERPYVRVVPYDDVDAVGEPSEPVLIPGHPPEVVSVTPTTGKEGSAFNVNHVANGTPPLNYSWDFGGGATPNQTTVKKPYIQLGAVGAYQSSLKVSNAFGSSKLDYVLSVEPAPPLIESAYPSWGHEGELVQFSSLVKGTGPFSYEWDFVGAGEPNTSNEASPTVQLIATGHYFVKLKVTNVVGEDNYSLPISIQGNEPHLDSLMPKDRRGRPGEQIPFTMTVSGSQPMTFSWDFGGGAEPNTSTEQSPVVILGDEGTYPVSVTITNNWGSDNAQFSLQVYDHWTHTWGGGGDEKLEKIAQLSDGSICAAGNSASFGNGKDDVLVMRYDYGGNLLWSSVWGENGDDEGLAIATDSNDNIYVTGSTDGYGAGYTDALLLKYDSNGNILWERTWGSTGYDYANAVTVDEDGYIYVAGQAQCLLENYIDLVLLKYDSDGNLLWQQDWGSDSVDVGNDIALDGVGGVYVAGLTISFGAGSEDALLVKYDTDGNLQWAKTYGGAVGDGAYAVAVSTGGEIYVAGATDNFGLGYRDRLLLTYDQTGNLLNEKTFGSGPSQWTYDIAVSPNGEIFLTGGEYGGTALRDWDIAWVRFSSDWEFIDGYAWDCGTPEEGNGVTVTPNGKIFVAGYSPNAGGTWFNAWGDETVPDGTETSPSISSVAVDGTVTSPAIAAQEPSGTVDVGGGNKDALVFMYDPGWF